MSYNSEAVRKYRQTEKGRENNRNQARKWRKAHPGQIPGQRERMLLRRFGITLDEYDQMYWLQGGVCGLCGGLQSSGRRLCVDHDHATGKIRALLCTPCNILVGYAEHERLRDALEYLEAFH